MSAAVDLRLSQLQAKCEGLLREKIVRCLRAAPGRAMTSREIALDIRLRHAPVQRVLCQMVVLDTIHASGPPSQPPRYRLYDCGYCEWCGLLSHRIVAGECPTCRGIVPTY